MTPDDFRARLLEEKRQLAALMAECDAILTAHLKDRPSPESPDFDRIALEIVQRVWGNEELDQPGLIIETSAVAEQIRQVWNARDAGGHREGGRRAWPSRPGQRRQSRSPASEFGPLRLSTPSTRV